MVIARQLALTCRELAHNTSMKRVTLHDLVRVARGAGLVADRYVVQTKPAIATRVSRARHHAVELSKIIMDIASERLKENSSQESQQPYESDNHGQQSSVTAASGAPPVPPTTEPKAPAAPPPLPDLIGFSALQHEDGDIKVNSAVTSLSNASSSGPLPPVAASPMREQSVPSTQLARMWGFGSLAARMAMGAAVDSTSRAFLLQAAPASGSAQAGQSQYHMSDENAERLAETLCRMRGAALKIGQMLSVQDEGMLPPALAKALDRVKQSADYMPMKQLESQLETEMGADWRSRFKDFDKMPIAAASIGQVHRATLLDGTAVAIKIQYPGVATSIESDLGNLKRLVTLTNILPPGLFIDQIIQVASAELAIECDYLAEAASQTRYRQLVINDSILSRHLSVPEVYPELSTRRILTSRFVNGVTIDKTTLLPQAVRNAIARTILINTMRELFEWRFIQSDPNFGNFLYDDSGPVKTVHMIDFGASRQYPKLFVDGYMKIVWAAANLDRRTVLEVSKELKFLTGDETPEMMNAHVEAALVVGEAFRSHDKFDFGNSKLTQRIGKFGSIFMKYRLTPPPSEAYSLHRKLAGAILLCIKLKAHITCRDILERCGRSMEFMLFFLNFPRSFLFPVPTGPHVIQHILRVQF